MARNRKNQSPGGLFGPALKVSLICGFIMVCCVGYVWQKRQIAELSRQIKSQETRRDALREKNLKLKGAIEALQLPAALAERAKDPRLGLAPPQPSQIWRLPEPQVEKPAVAVNEQRFAAGKGGGTGLP